MTQETFIKHAFKVTKYGTFSNTYVILYNENFYIPTYVVKEINISLEEYNKIFLLNNAKISSSNNFYFKNIEDAQNVVEQLNILVELMR